jgi:exopolysaccharide production protein ExoQ
VRTSVVRQADISGRAWVHRAGRHFLARAERWYVVLVLLTASGAILPYLSWEGLLGNLDLDRVMRYSVLTFVLGYMLTQSGQFLRAVSAQMLSSCVPLLAVASTAWSIVGDQALSTSLHFAVVTGFALYLAARFPRDELVRLVGWFLGVAVVASLIILFIRPGFGVDPGSGGVRGAFDHKNTFGMYMVLSTLTFALIGKDAVRRRWIPWTVAAVSLVLLVFSRSGTGLTVMASLCALVPLYHALRFYRGLRIPVLIVCVLVGAGVLAVLIYDRSPVVAILGKDPTLTGRTDLWGELLVLIRQRPWLGHGFYGLWGVCSDGGWLLIACLWGAHNGLLGLWFDLGLVGLSMFVLAFTGAAITALAHSQSTRAAVGLWPVAFLSFFFLYNVTEDLIMRSLGLWILFLAAVGSLRLHRQLESLVPPWSDVARERDASSQSLGGAAAGPWEGSTVSPGVRASLRTRGRQRSPRKG